MKTCPTCQSQFTDDTLSFCLQDGTPLVPNGSAPTISFSEHETLVAARPTNPPIHGFDRRTEQLVAPTRSRFLIFAVVFLSIVLLAFVGVGVWILYTGGSPYSRTNPMLANANTDRPTPPAKRTDTVANKSMNTSATPEPVAATPDAAKIKTDVAARIESWRSAIEAVDLDSFMGNYANDVDYYNSRRSISSVRDDKQRAFVKFDTMTMKITDLKVTPGPGDSRATAVFDKEWEFTNAAGDRNSGKVRQQLSFEKIDGKWLITLEKDLVVIRRPTS